MANTSPLQPQDDAQRSERYTPGYSKSTVTAMQNRSAASHATFFIPRLQSGMRLLDCGCGPGSITIDLAEIVAPGEVVGIDIAESQLAQATASARERQVSNVRFETASIYDLPFPEGSFDAVFSHAMLGHLREPLKAIRGMYHVLKPGGLLGLRDMDYAGDLIWPLTPGLEQLLHETVIQLQKHNGGDPYIGRCLKSLLHQAGFGRVVASASYECFGTPESIQFITDILSGYWASEAFADRAVQLGLIEPSGIDKILATWQEWGHHPDAFWARPWCEVIGWKQ